MKKLAVLAIILVAAFSLTACVGGATSGEKIKCPSCGYQFDPEEHSQ